MSVHQNCKNTTAGWGGRRAGVELGGIKMRLEYVKKCPFLDLFQQTSKRWAAQ